MSYYSLCIFSVDGLDTEKETNEFFLKIFHFIITAETTNKGTAEKLYFCPFPLAFTT